MTVMTIDGDDDADADADAGDDDDDADVGMMLVVMLATMVTMVMMVPTVTMMVTMMSVVLRQAALYGKFPSERQHVFELSAPSASVDAQKAVRTSALVRIVFFFVYFFFSLFFVLIRGKSPCYYSMPGTSVYALHTALS